MTERNGSCASKGHGFRTKEGNTALERFWMGLEYKKRQKSQVYIVLKDGKSLVKRLLNKGGIFAFTISPTNIGRKNKEYSDSIEFPTGWGVSIWKHSQEYIRKIFEDFGFELIKEQRVLFKDADKIEYNMEFSVLITRCL